MCTFAELGIPFPLFEAPADEAIGYEGDAACRLCRRADRHGFDLGVGDALILPCPACGAENGLDVCNRKDAPCRACAATVPFPESLKPWKQLLACYDCLRAGRAAIAKETEFGLATWRQAFEGVTYGAPGLRTDQFEVVLLYPQDDWYGARVPSEHLWELLRTPCFRTWRGEKWLFCCRRPMSYVGDRPQPADELAPDALEAFRGILSDPGGRGPERFQWRRPSHYVFRCPTCGRCRATYDSD